MEALFIFAIFMIAVVAYCIKNDQARRRALEAEQARLKALQISDVDSMSGWDFEQYVGKLLVNEGYTDVVVTKKSGDGGVDAMASKGGLRYSIQVKRYGKPVGRRAVTDAVGGMIPNGCNASMVITNNRLTAQATQYAKAHKCEVVDRNVLSHWIQRYQATSPAPAQASSALPPANKSEVFAAAVVPCVEPEGAWPDDRPLSSEMTQWLRRAAERQYPKARDASLREFIFNAQVTAHEELINLRPRDIPEDVLQGMFVMARLQHPKNFQMRLFALNQQIDAYRKLEHVSVNDVPGQTFQHMKELAKKEYPRDFNLQLFKLDQQIEAYRKLQHMNIGGIPADVLSKLQARAFQEFPDDCSRQVLKIEQQVSDYKALHRLKANRVPSHILSRIQSEAARQYPDDYSRQMIQVQCKIEAHPAHIR